MEDGTYCPDKVASNEGQPKSCFGSSIPNPLSPSLPTEVGQVFLSGLEVVEGGGPGGPATVNNHRPLDP